MPSLELKKLLENLHSVFEKNPRPKLALRMTFSFPFTTAAITVDDSILTVKLTPEDPGSPFDCLYTDRDIEIVTSTNSDVGVIKPCEDLTYDLRQWSIEALIEDVESHPGFGLELLDKRLAKMLAFAVLDGITAADLSAPVDLYITTNPLWILLKPVAAALRGHEDNIDAALAQLNILTSRKFFADFWGRFLGVVRDAGETDVPYTQRIVDTILLKRDNNVALEKIVADRLAVDVSVEDILPLLLNVNNKPGFSKIPGEVYNAGNFLVIGPMGGVALHDLVRRHKAAGTRAFFIERDDTIVIDQADDFVVSNYDLSIFDNPFADRDFLIIMATGSDAVIVDTDLPVWSVGQTPMPGSTIGHR